MEPFPEIITPSAILFLHAKLQCIICTTNSRTKTCVMIRDDVYSMYYCTDLFNLNYLKNVVILSYCVIAKIFTL